MDGRQPDNLTPTSLTAKEKIDLSKAKIELLSGAFGVLLKASIALGGLILVAYSAKERFFYDVSSVAAVSVLLVVLLSFSVVIAVGIFYGAFVSLWFIGIFILVFGYTKYGNLVRMKPHFSSKIIIIFSSITFLIFLLNISWHKISDVRIQLITFFLLAGFLINIILGVERLNRNGLYSSMFENNLFTLLIPPSLLLVYTLAASNILDMSMSLLSFRVEGEFVALNNQAYEKVEFIAKVAAIPVFPCRLGDDLWLLKGTTVVWHGVGTTSYLRLTSSDNSVLVPIASSGVEPIRINRPPTKSCPSKPGEPEKH